MGKLKISSLREIGPLSLDGMISLLLDEMDTTVERISEAEDPKIIKKKWTKYILSPTNLYWLPSSLFLKPGHKPVRVFKVGKGPETVTIKKEEPKKEAILETRSHF